MTARGPGSGRRALPSGRARWSVPSRAWTASSRSGGGQRISERGAAPAAWTIGSFSAPRWGRVDDPATERPARRPRHAAAVGCRNHEPDGEWRERRARRALRSLPRAIRRFIARATSDAEDVDDLAHATSSPPRERCTLRRPRLRPPLADRNRGAAPPPPAAGPGPFLRRAARAGGGADGKPSTPRRP